VVSATDFCSSVVNAFVNLLNSFGAPGQTEIAEADIAEAMNFLREHLFCRFMALSSVDERNSARASDGRRSS
jgi:hypothetical protein